MPKLGNKEYAYTAAGQKQYQKDKKRLGYNIGGLLGTGEVKAFDHLKDMRSRTSPLAGVSPNTDAVSGDGSQLTPQPPQPQATAYGSGQTEKQEPLQPFQEGGQAVSEQMDAIMPEEQQLMAETTLPDGEMEEDYIDFVVSEALMPEEEQYLLERLGEDDQLSIIFDKVIQTASEFAGSGLVEGPGNAVSDSIPARLSDGEFVMTSKAANQIGPENLQGMMDEAELTADIEQAERRIMQAGGYVEEEEEKDEDLKVAVKPKKQEVKTDTMVEKELKKAMMSQSPRFSLFDS